MTADICIIPFVIQLRALVISFLHRRSPSGSGPLRKQPPLGRQLCAYPVMPGVDPGIHLQATQGAGRVDCEVSPGDDDN